MPLPHSSMPPNTNSREFSKSPLFFIEIPYLKKTAPILEQRMIRINPNRSGADTVLRILREIVC
ncbi:hypothetical protein [Xenorhabdus poinarii]|uniref:hypothetical protein n=1 Tax=Xenorhabdus poinarii TaxID=40577 RepID=UPI003F517E0D